jgi:hypothetical protein
MNLAMLHQEDAGHIHTTCLRSLKCRLSVLTRRNHYRRLAIAKLEGKLSCSETGISSSENAPSHPDSQHEHGEVDAVAAIYQHPFARLYAMLPQSNCDPLRKQACSRKSDEM